MDTNIRELEKVLTVTLAAVLIAQAGGAQRPAPGGTIRVAAAADLARALPQIAASYQKRTGDHVTCIFGSTGLLTKQAENGAPFDVLLSADERHVLDLERAGKLAQGSRRLYAIGRLVIWTRSGARAAASIADLAGDGFRTISIANPAHAPYGAAAVQAFKSAGILPAVQRKLVYGENVQQALRYAETGAADCGMVSQALVAQTNGTVTPVPQNLYQPIQQALGVLRASPNAARALGFARYLTGPESRAILGHFGFTLPPLKAR